MKLVVCIFCLVVLLLLSGCIQPEEKPKIVEKVASEAWVPDGIVGDNEYARSMTLRGPAKQGYSGGEMEISWKNDQDHIYMALNGTATGWLAVGFEPAEWMKDADISLALFRGGQPIVLDEFSIGNYGPHIEDIALGGSDDIVEYGGSRKGERSIFEFKKRLNSNDKYDKALAPGQTISMIWAMSNSPELGIKHNTAFGEGILMLTEEGKPGVSSASLSPRESEGLLFIWEEEKTARDLYQSLHKANNLSIFLDLERSEQNHMNQAKVLIDKYGLQIPVQDEPGAFKNKTLIELYNDLLSQGRKSPEDALKVAAAFEEVSILDLEKELSIAKVEDLRTVYQGLLAGSRKHLRSYVRDLQENGISYEPQYLSREEFEKTVGTL